MESQSEDDRSYKAEMCRIHLSEMVIKLIFSNVKKATLFSVVCGHLESHWYPCDLFLLASVGLWIWSCWKQNGNWLSRQGLFFHLQQSVRFQGEQSSHWAQEYSIDTIIWVGKMHQYIKCFCWIQIVWFLTAFRENIRWLAHHWTILTVFMRMIPWLLADVGGIEGVWRCQDIPTTSENIQNMAGIERNLPVFFSVKWPWSVEFPPNFGFNMYLPGQTDWQEIRNQAEYLKFCPILISQIDQGNEQAGATKNARCLGRQLVPSFKYFEYL